MVARYSGNTSLLEVFRDMYLDASATILGQW